MSQETNQETTPIIFLDDVSVTFKTRTGSILHPNRVKAVQNLSLKLFPGETIGMRIGPNEIHIMARSEG